MSDFSKKSDIFAGADMGNLSIGAVLLIAVSVVLLLSWGFFLWRLKRFDVHKQDMREYVDHALVARDEAQDEVKRAIGLFQDKQREYETLQVQQELTKGQ